LYSPAIRIRTCSSTTSPTLSSVRTWSSTTSTTLSPATTSLLAVKWRETAAACWIRDGIAAKETEKLLRQGIRRPPPDSRRGAATTSSSCNRIACRPPAAVFYRFLRQRNLLTRRSNLRDTTGIVITSQSRKIFPGSSSGKVRNNGQHMIVMTSQSRKISPGSSSGEVRNNGQHMIVMTSQSRKLPVRRVESCATTARI